jgi:hypothetical protein
MKRTFLVIVLCSVSIGSVAGGIYYWWLHTPPPMPKTIDDALAVVQSPRYKHLDESRRQAYLEKARAIFDALPPQDRLQVIDRVQADPTLERAVRQAREDWMVTQFRQYLAADKAKRQQILDQMIAAMEAGAQLQRLAHRGGPDPGDANAQARQQERMAAAKKHMQEWTETGNPQAQQYMMEFLGDLMRRRQELGLNPDPFPHGPRGGTGK